MVLTSEKNCCDTLDESEARDLSSAYVELAAALMRYVRGGGDISQLRRAVLNAGRVTDLTKNMMNGHLERHLAPLRQWPVPYDEANTPERHYAHETLAKGALQYVASRLDRLSALQSHGEQELDAGVRFYQEYKAKAYGVRGQSKIP